MQLQNQWAASFLINLLLQGLSRKWMPGRRPPDRSHCSLSGSPGRRYAHVGNRDWEGCDWGETTVQAQGLGIFFFLHPSLGEGKLLQMPDEAEGNLILMQVKPRGSLSGGKGSGDAA